MALRSEYTLYFQIPSNLLTVAHTHSLESFPQLYVKFKQKAVSPVASWLVRTAYELRAEGIRCEFTDTEPKEGIMIGTNQTIPYLFRPSHKQLYVHIITDNFSQHPYAQINVTQNKDQFNVSRRSFYIPHWPQAGIIPRNTSRGNRVNNIAYLGDPPNLTRELQSQEWRERLQHLGFHWMVKPPEGWHDYSDVDVIVAVRRFNTQERYKNKPASKLYNAWIAGVPALLGIESAYRAEMTSPLDYIEVDSLEAIIENLILLRNDAEFYQRMIARSRERAAQISSHKFRLRWKKLIQEEIYPLYERWVSMPRSARYTFLISRYFELRRNGIRKRLNRNDL